MAVVISAQDRPSKHAKGTGAAFVYERLREEILNLKLEPGSTLDEAGLVERFGLSRTPVREALIRLAADGLVIMLPNRGAQVATLNLTDFPRYVEALDLLHRVINRLAALRRSPAQLEAIEAARVAFETAVREGDALSMTESNRDFHMAVADAANNNYLSPHYARLLDEGMRLLRVPFAFEPEGDGNGLREHIAKIVAEHKEITDAIAAQDATRAEKLGSDHSELFRSRFMQYLQQNDTGQIAFPD